MRYRWDDAAIFCSAIAYQEKPQAKLLASSNATALGAELSFITDGAEKKIPDEVDVQIPESSGPQKMILALKQ